MGEAILPIASIEVGTRFRRDMGDLDALAASIDRVGLLHAIVCVQGENGRLVLVAGERRLRACERLGWDKVPVRVLPRLADLLQAEHDENMVRLAFAPSEAVAIADALRPAIEQAAKEREHAGTPSAETAQGRTRDVLAKAVGMGHTKLAQATEVVHAAEERPVLQPVVERMDETGNVSAAHDTLKALPDQPTPEEVQRALASRDAAYDRNYPGWREQEAADAAVIRWWDSWKVIRREMTRQSPAGVIAHLDREGLEDLESDLVDLGAFLAACRAAIDAARIPHLVKGDVS